MEPQTIELSRLQELSATSLQLTYNTDAADTLSLTLRPENYAELPLQALDRLTVTDGERIVFSGVVPMGANCAAEAAQGETVDIELQSDYYVLDHTVYAKLNSKGEAVFSRLPSNKKTLPLSELCSIVDSWLGTYLPSRLRCFSSAIIPTPASNGTAPCSSLLGDGMRWAPDAVVVQRYGEQNTLTVAKPAQLGEPLVLSPSTHPLQSVSLTARHDLVVPVCALVGGVHKTWPDGADIRELGAFVYAVPVEPQNPDEAPSNGAGSSPASQKMVIKGLAIPERRIFESGPAEYNTTPIIGDSNVAKFIRAFFPEYSPFIPYMEAGACLVEAVSKDDLEAELEESNPDEDAKVPANYEDDVNSWAVGDSGVYVLTQGSFAASSQSRKNLRGLRWCKATLSIVLCVKARPSDVPPDMFATAEELFPGRRKKDKVKYAYVRKTLTCNLINRRYRVYDPARNAPCSSDPEYSPEQDRPEEEDTPTAADYKAAMSQYFHAASKLQHEGSVSMLYDGSLNPAELTGRWLRVEGMRDAWATMQAVIRSVSWDYGQKKLSLSVGPRSVMGFSEYLERRVIARNRGRDKAQQEALAFDPRDEEAQAEEENEMSVSPSISAGTDSTSTGRWVKPFTLFTNPETKKLTLKGGTFTRKGQSYTVEDTETQIYHGSPNDKPWVEGSKVKLKMLKHKTTGYRTFNIYQ